MISLSIIQSSKSSENEIIRYVDFTYLYPTINFCRAIGFTKDTQNDI